MKTRVAYFCSDPIGLPVLARLHGGMVEGFELCGVVTGPDRRAGRGKQLQPNAIAAWGAAHDVSVHQPQRPGDDTVAWLASRRAEVLLVIAYGHILRRQVLEAVPLGAWNLHGSLLPKLRGASPVETAIATGERQTGVSLMRMVRAMDAGPVLATRVVSINDHDTGPALRIKMGHAAADLTAEAFGEIHQAEPALREQDHAAASYCRKIVRDDRNLDFSAPAMVLARRIRALSGWPGSVLELAGGVAIKVDQPAVGPQLPGLVPGEVIGLVDGGLGIGTGDGLLIIGTLQKPGGRMLPAADFLRGFPLEKGLVLKSLPMDGLLVTRGA